MSGRKFLTRDEWLAAAMELLRTRGIGGVRILPLAKQLGVSRGSFYWHFEDHDDLLRSMLDWWDHEMTDAVIRFSKESHRSVERRSNRNQYETAVRTWAESDKRAGKTLTRVVQKRIGYVTGLFREAGFSPAEAQARGNLLAVYVMSEDSILAFETVEKRLRMLKRQIRLLMS